MTPFNVAVTTSAKVLLAPGSSKRVRFISNVGATLCYITSASGDAAILGTPLAPGLTLRIEGGAAKWVRTASSTTTVSVSDANTQSFEDSDFATSTELAALQTTLETDYTTTTDLEADFATAAAVALLKGYETIHFFLAGGQSTGTLKDAALIGVAGTIVDVRAKLGTAPVGSAFNVDVNKNGTTIFTTQGARPIFADGSPTSSTTAPAVTAVAAGDYLSIDVDQVGSGTAGSDLMVSVTIKRALATS